jgi:NADP-dependent 3-hydroxy acid dehydrogenase YdfG
LERDGIRVSVLHPSSVEKQLPYAEVPPRTDGLFVKLSQGQVADIAIFMIEQPENVNIRELTVTPSGAYR